MTVDYARKHKKPCYVVDLGQEVNVESVREWMRGDQIKILNVAGPRVSKHPQVHGMAVELLRRLLTEFRVLPVT